MKIRNRFHIYNDTVEKSAMVIDRLGEHGPVTFADPHRARLFVDYLVRALRFRTTTGINVICRIGSGYDNGICYVVRFRNSVQSFDSAEQVLFYVFGLVNGSEQESKFPNRFAVLDSVREHVNDSYRFENAGFPKWYLD